MVAEWAHRTPAGRWLVGQGWNHNLWGGRWPTRQDLDAVAPEKLVKNAVNLSASFSRMYKCPTGPSTSACFTEPSQSSGGMERSKVPKSRASVPPPATPTQAALNVSGKLSGQYITGAASPARYGSTSHHPLSSVGNDSSVVGSPSVSGTQCGSCPPRLT